MGPDAPASSPPLTLFLLWSMQLKRRRGMALTWPTVCFAIRCILLASYVTFVFPGDSTPCDAIRFDAMSARSVPHSVIFLHFLSMPLLLFCCGSQDLKRFRLSSPPPAWRCCFCGLVWPECLINWKRELFCSVLVKARGNAFKARVLPKCFV